MSQETLTERMTTGISRRITGSDELNSLERHPLFVRDSPEAMLLGELSQESNDDLRAVLILVGQVDFIAENDEPLVGLSGPKSNT